MSVNLWHSNLAVLFLVAIEIPNQCILNDGVKLLACVQGQRA